MSSDLPAMIGRYRIAGVLGQGGMGVVYRASVPGSPELGEVALKVLKADGAEVARRFAREARIRIEHPNVVRSIESGAAQDGVAFIAFELLEGESLSERLRRGVLSAAETVELGVQICRGLSAAHALGIVHRDLKPSNIFICRDGTAKILDFGIAHAGALATQLTLAGQVVGTPSYVSPEQARGELAADGRADIWSLGTVLYEALTGVRAFYRAEGVLSTLLAVAIEELVPPAMKNPLVPARLAAVVERALFKAKEQRWPTAEDFGVALAASLAPQPAETKPRPSLGTTHERRVVTVVLAKHLHLAAGIEAAIARGGGVFVPLMGDRAIGIFGGERTIGDESRRAAAAAIEARAFVDRIAVVSGRAMIAGTRVSGAMLKDAEAALEVESRGVVVDAETARALGVTLPELARVRSAEGSERGCFELLALPAAQSSGTFSGPWSTLLLGREAELAQASAVMSRVVADRRGAALLVEGTAGTGKTRLKEEILRLIREKMRGAIVLEARGELAERGASMSLLAAAIASRIAGPSSPDVVRALADEAMKDFAADAAPFLGELLGVRMPMTPALGAALDDPQLMKDRLRMVALDYFFGLAESAPVALFIDDLHRADAASLELIASMIDRLDEGPVFVFLTARPELGELLLGKEVSLVQPSSLGLADVARLASEIVGAKIDDSLARAIADRTAGNPAFVEQIALALRDRARRSKASDAPNPSHTRNVVDELPLPISIEAAVQSRLDHLPAEEKELLKSAAVFSRAFTLRELGALGVVEAEALIASLAKKDLMRRIRSNGGADATQYRFHSPLLREVAYRMLPEAARTALHLRAAEAAETAASGARDLEEIARHFEAAGEVDEAARAYAAAAHGAAKRGDSEAVLRLSSWALRLGIAERARFELFMERGDAFRFSGRRDDQATAFAAAAACAANEIERARALNEEVDWLDRAGRNAEAVAAAQRAVALAEAAAHANREPAAHANRESAAHANRESVAHANRESAAHANREPVAHANRAHEVLVIALGRQAMALLHAGRAQEARAASERAAELAAAAPVLHRAFAHAWRGQIAAALGDSGAARDAFRSARACYLEAGDVRRAAGAATNLADAYNRVGAYAEAEAALGEALKGCRRVGNRVMEGYALVNLGYARMMLARFEDALSALDQAGALAKLTHQPRLELMARVHRVRASLELDAPEDVAREASDAAAAARAIRAAGLEVNALTIAARARLKAGDLFGALETSTLALALRDQLGGIEEDEADVFLTHAEILLALDRREESRAIILRGRARLMEIAAGISDAEWRQRFLHNVPAHRFMLQR